MDKTKKSTMRVLPWYDQLGLSPDGLFEEVPLYNCGPLRAEPPEGVDAILPSVSPSCDELFSRLPQTEYILVALDIQELCMYKMTRHADGEEYRYKPVTEIGFTYLDMRTVFRGGRRATLPGDRGSSWFRLMNPSHFIIEEYQDHRGHLCQSDTPHNHTYSFAFGKSKTIKEDHIARRLQEFFLSLQRSNRTKKEKASNTNRQIIFLTFGSDLVERTLSRLGLSWFDHSNVKLWDVEKDLELELLMDWRKTEFEYVLEMLGLRFVDNRFGSIMRCAGNASVFLIQAVLALFYKNGWQSVAFAARQPMPWLPYTWVGFTLDQANIAPGEMPRRRAEDQVNDSKIPQKMNGDAFRDI
ncbi:hypothetical protein B0J13DRAFT_622669 [Dactylonectria estremocensis]|uniref:Gfd2/YDR514C-like C-terminal domain-containing protein n=1 Tax=Dactylonectria estremocensis TaxID=1079267 RepID=A0A9P9J876_9HYPO|nr:hypothetical protein B0J13DRAFT_622669 [Dactylonectria estremocensis]